MPTSSDPRGPRSRAELSEWFASGGRTLVALSGGVDSAVVAAIAHGAMPGRVEAATLVGPAVAASEVARARDVARAIGLPHVLVPVDPLAVEGYRTNPSNRCYFCRSTEAGALRAYGAPRGVIRFVDGVHRDDLGDDRPGIRALDEAGFEHPLLWAAWGKARVRAEARALGLPNGETPANACLASRVPHGTPIDAPTLRRIEEAEATLTARGYRRVRVRMTPDGARVEVDPEEVERLSAPAESEAIRARLLDLGFAHVEIDPRGYRRRANA